ncbi:MAG: OmpA family protein [bacterium]|nr:OmpA family protein [bacterium]
MKKSALTLLFVCFCLLMEAQIAVIGHNLLNNAALKNTKIFVTCGGVITKTLTTLQSSDFKVMLDFGKLYQVYFQNDKCPVMYLELDGKNIPSGRFEHMLTYELNVPFVYKIDEDIDTTVFSRPFHRILYTGGTRLCDDSLYNREFAKNVVKKHKAENAVSPDIALHLPTVILAGKVQLSSDVMLAVGNRPISLLGKNGELIKSSFTNRFGAFAFTGISPDGVGKLKIEVRENENPGGHSLMNSKNRTVSSCRPSNSQCEWTMDDESLKQLIDNNFTTNIGGKLVASSMKEKKFFADKNVYLCNKLNTVIQQTRTNLLGTFVFEDIRPDKTYFICVDKWEVAPGVKIDVLNKEDRYISTFDTITAGRTSLKLNTSYNARFNEISIGDDEMKMDVEATIYGDNVNNPIGKLKIVLLNDNYEPIDSAVTDNFGTFKFKYLPFLKRFYLSAENTDNILDVFKNILIYSNDANLIKIMTHQKGNRFTYKPVSADITRLRDIEMEDPWLELIEKDNPEKAGSGEVLISKGQGKMGPKLIVENILFEPNKYAITPQAKEVLDKVILVLNANKALKIEVGAHTDSKGSAAENLKLSEMRAKTVQKYITASGIETLRVMAKGYGETQLLNHCDDNSNCSEVEHAQNRRIEFKIIEGLQNTK